MSDVRPTPFFIADHFAVDLLNSVASPVGEPIEWLANGKDLVAWLEQAGALPAEVAARYRSQAGSRALDAVAAQARELREWFRGFVRHHSGRPLERSALRELAPLNQLLESDETYRQVETAVRNENERSGFDAFRWQTKRRWRSPKALLLPIAEAIGEMVCEKDFTYVRRCESPACTLWFLDVSKSHARRWCSMAVCGNRAKAASHRARARRHP